MKLGFAKLFNNTVDHFKRYPIIVTPAVVLGLVTFILTLVLLGTNYGFYGLGGASVGVAVGSFLLYILASAVISFIALGWILGMAAELAESGTTSLSSGFSRFGSSFGSILVAFIVTGLMTGIGLILCILPGIVAAYFLMFTFASLVLGGLGPMEAIRTSFSTVKNNAGDALVVAAISVGIAIGAALVGGILGIIPVLGILLNAVVSGIGYTFILLLTVEAYKMLTAAAPTEEAVQTPPGL